MSALGYSPPMSGPLLGAQSITRTRYAASSVDSEGYSVAGSSTDSTITADVQELTGDDRQDLPEGFRFRSGKKLYVPTDSLRTVDQAAGTKADRVTIDSVVYEVVQVGHRPTLLPHQRVVVTRVQETE